MINENPIFKSESGYTYTVDELTECIVEKGYPYDFQYSKEHTVQPPRPFSAKEMDKLMSMEEIFVTYRHITESKLGTVLQNSVSVNGDTLALMENLLKAFDDGAIRHGTLAFFLLSNDFISTISAPIGELYSHLKKYPVEREALSSISQTMKHQFNFIKYLDDIIENGSCSSGFPRDLSEMFSLVLGLKLYVQHEEKRITIEDTHTNEKGASKEEIAFFDRHPMTNYLGIKVQGFSSYNPKSEETVKKFIDYLEQRHNLNYHDVPAISINNDKLTVYTKANREFKRVLREDIVNTTLGVETENVQGEFRFTISDMTELQEKLNTINLKTRDEIGIFKDMI